MHQVFRKFIWFIIIVGSLIAVLWGWLVHDAAVGTLIGMVAGGVAFCWASFSAWFWGLSRQIRGHMNRSVEHLTFVSKDVGKSREADYIRALEKIAAEQTNSKKTGVSEHSLLAAVKDAPVELQKINWDSVEAEDERLVNIPKNSVYFLFYNDCPFVARIGGRDSFHDFEHEAAVSTGRGKKLELCAKTLEEANAITKWLRQQTANNSIYRRQMLMVASPQDGSIGQTIFITKRPNQLRERIILPENMIQTIERLVDSRLRHGEELNAIGHSANLGILLHGVPGTGKTLIVRYLISRCTQHTVIVPSDMAVETLRESFRLAQYLQPAIMVLEDVDLLAQDRQSGRSVDGLQELMNQLDGLPDASDTIVLMSTNRPEVLEPALASRPGRVSQAIEFHVPDEADREQLFRLFLANVDAEFDFGHWSQRTGGASPAFIEELCKRAIIFALDRRPDSDRGSRIKVLHEDLDAAIHELCVIGGELTSKSLGFPNGDQ